MCRVTPCDGKDGTCPYNASNSIDCRNFCGLGVDENDFDDYTECESSESE